MHWHADPSVRVEYVATDAARQTIPYVRVTDAKGQVKEYVAKDAKEEVIRAADRRTMDCVDCHIVSRTRTTSATSTSLAVSGATTTRSPYSAPPSGTAWSASLAYCLRRARIEVEGLTANVTTHVARNEKGRFRIGSIDVELEPQTGAGVSIERCEGLFEDFCSVTASVQRGIPVESVAQAHGRRLAWSEGIRHFRGPGVSCPRRTRPRGRR